MSIIKLTMTADYRWRADNGNCYYVPMSTTLRYVLPVGTLVWFNTTTNKIDSNPNKGEPSIDSLNGIKIWYSDGKLHRIDGPAVESGQFRWFIEDKEYTEDEYNSETILDLRLKLSVVLPKSAI